LVYELFAEGVIFHNRKYAATLVPLYEIEVLKGHDVDCVSCVDQRKAAEDKEKALRANAEASQRTAAEAEARRQLIERARPALVSVQSNREALEVIGSVLSATAAPCAVADAAPIKFLEVSKAPEESSPLRTVPVQKMQYKSVELEFIKSANYQQTIQLRDTIDTPCWAILILMQRRRLSPPMYPNQFPIRGATLCLNGKDVMRFDCCDLHEWNWLKMGLDVPSGMECALFPFSRLNNQKGHRALINMGLCRSAELRLDLNSAMAPVGWGVCVAGLTRNLMQCGDYTCVLRF
jgi:hypothetical protein